jgi:hypothetical protein
VDGGDVWIVPGEPLRGGAGWRIWYSKPGTAEFTPQTPTVLRAGHPTRVTTRWALLAPYPGLDRRMGVLEVTLDEAERFPGASYDVLIPETPMRQYQWRTLPDTIDGGVSFILASCFYLPADKDGSYAAGLRDVTKIEQPLFKLLIGDQVYQDWPPNLTPMGDPVVRFARRYDEYWGHPAYQEVLTSSPNFFTCDDHEFWNGFPERAKQVPSTWTEEWREDNGKVAGDLFCYYQTSVNPSERGWFGFEVGRVSFFVTDSRSERTELTVDHPHFFGDDQWKALEKWARELTGPGVLVLGQPLFGKKGDWKEPALRDFDGDFNRLCSVVETALGREHDILVLTGDIHRARHFTATLVGVAGGPGVHELVASAASRLQVGPAVREPDVYDDALKFTVDHGGIPRTWDAAPVPPTPGELPSADNNLAVIRMSPGTATADTAAPRVRFSLAVWSLRPFTKVWSKLLPWRQPKGSLVKLYEKELELR